MHNRYTSCLRIVLTHPWHLLCLYIVHAQSLYILAPLQIVHTIDCTCSVVILLTQSLHLLASLLPIVYTYSLHLLSVRIVHTQLFCTFSLLIVTYSPCTSLHFVRLFTHNLCATSLFMLFIHNHCTSSFFMLFLRNHFISRSSRCSCIIIIGLSLDVVDTKSLHLLSLHVHTQSLSVVVVLVVVDCFCVALFFALEQIHCARM